MFSLLASWLRRHGRNGGRTGRPLPARRSSGKPWLESLEDRSLLSFWSTVATLPTAREALGAATGSDGRIYAMGGSGGDDRVFAYSPGSNSWSTAPSMPTTRFDVSAITGADGRIYTIGGEVVVTSTLGT